MEGEEDIMVSHLASFYYREGGDKVQEILFQSFKVINVEMVGPIGEVKIAEFLMASLKDAQTIIKSGHPEEWGRILELSVNKDRSRLGYNSPDLKKPAPMTIKGKVLPLSNFFSSVGHLVDGHISAM